MKLYDILPEIISAKAREVYGCPNRMADALGISQSSLSKFLNRKVDTRWSLVAKLLEGLQARILFSDIEIPIAQPCSLESKMIEILHERRKWVGLRDFHLNKFLDDLVLGKRAFTVCICNILCEALDIPMTELVGKAKYELRKQGIGPCKLN